MITFDAPDALHLGDVLEGSVTWTDLRDGELRVVLRWDTSGLATHQVYNILNEVRRDVTGTPSGRLTFHWRVPREAPPTVEGVAVNVVWTICAELVVGHQTLETAQMAIRVRPRVVARAEIGPVVPVATRTRSHCDAVVPDDASECPRCGIVLTKIGMHAASIDVPQNAAPRSRMKVASAAIGFALGVLGLLLSARQLVRVRVDGRVLDGWYQGEQGYAQAVALQKQTHRPMLLYFGSSSCRICVDRLDAFFDSQETRRRLKNFIVVQLNPNRSAQLRISRQYQIARFGLIVAADDDVWRRVAPPGDSEALIRAIDDPVANGNLFLEAGLTEAAQAEFARVGGAPRQPH